MHSLNFTPLIPDFHVAFFFIVFFSLYMSILLKHFEHYLHFLVCPRFCYVLFEPWGVTLTKTAITETKTEVSLMWFPQATNARP